MPIDAVAQLERFPPRRLGEILRLTGVQDRAR